MTPKFKGLREKQYDVSMDTTANGGGNNSTGTGVVNSG